MPDATAHLIGVRDMEAEFAKMIKVKNFCDEQGVSYPEEVEIYFGGLANESEAYIREEMQEVDLVGLGGDGIQEYATTIPYTICDADDDCCVLINLTDIPPGIVALKLRMTW